MSSRAQLDSAQPFKAWPPSPAEIQLLQQKMAPTATSSSNRHRTTDHTTSRRHHSRSATAGDPLSSSRPSKSSVTTKSHAFHASSSSEYVTKPSTSRSQHPTDIQDPRVRVSSTTGKHRDGTPRIPKSKPVQDQYVAYAMLGTPAPAPSASTPAWTAYSEAPSEAPRKHRTKDKDRDKAKDKDKSSRHEREALKEVARNPYEQRPAGYAASTLGRNFKQRTEEVTKQTKASSHRRYPTDEEMLAAQVSATCNRITTKP